MDLEKINEFDVKTHSDKLIREYLEKLNYSNDYINTMSDVLDTVNEIMVRNEVQSQSVEWDHIGAQLKDGKVILPDGMEKVADELVKENALYSFFLPEKFGGLGECPFMIGPLTETIAMHDISLQMLIMLGFSILEPLLMYYQEPFDPIIEEFASGERMGYVAFTEPQAGSNLKNVKSTSEKEGDEYILNGTKIFITNGGYANTGLFLARNMVDGKADGTNVFLVDNLDNIDTVRLEEKTGIHGNATAELRFDNVTVPEEYLIAERGNGYRKVLERLLGMRIGVSFQGTAAAKRAFQLARQYANDRVQFDKPIINFPDINRKLSEMVRQIPRLDDYAYRGAYALHRYIKGWIPADVGASGKAMAEESAAKMVPGIVRGGLVHYFASSTKLYNSEIANSLVYDAVQIFGGMGFVSETEVNRISRDIRVLPIYEGTSEIHNWILGRSEQAIQMLPKFKKPYSEYEESTMYERTMFDRYQGLEDII